MTRGLSLVVTTVEHRHQADDLARTLVQEDLAACVQVGGAVRSWYRWQGEVQDAPEVPLLLKVRHDRLDACLGRLEALHPYDTPEILAWPAEHAAAGYLSWAYGEDTP
jgi:periplasmic divalent cation tolerance protein